MKKLLFLTFSFLLAVMVHGQWTAVPVGTATTDVTAMTSYADTVLVGFAGDGIYKSTNLGNSWNDISGNLINKNVNNIEAGPWPMLFVSTTTGPFFTLDQQSYSAAQTTGLTNTDISFYFIGGDLDENDFSVGTHGGGFFTGPELDGPWTSFSNGLSGDALFINEFSGYDYGDTSTYILATDGGVFYSNNEFNTWRNGSNGLVGDQLKVTGVLLLNTFSFITTEAGAFYSFDLGLNWVPVFPGEKFNLMHLVINQSGTFTVFILGETSYVTSDLQTWVPIPTQGEVVAATTTSTELFVAIAATKINSGVTGGGIYRQPISWILTDLPQAPAQLQNVTLTQNYPNPFQNSTTFTYTINEPQVVDIRLFDLLGREVKSMVNSFQNAGLHELEIFGEDLNPGVYSLVLRTNSTTESIKLIKK